MLATFAQRDRTAFGRIPTNAARCSPVNGDLAATRSAGVPSNTIRPPSCTAPGPRSMIERKLNLDPHVVHRANRSPGEPTCCRLGRRHHDPRTTCGGNGVEGDHVVGGVRGQASHGTSGSRDQSVNSD